MAKSKRPTVKVSQAQEQPAESIDSSNETAYSNPTESAVTDNPAEKREVGFLPGALRPPRGDIHTAMTWIYGPPKIGKSTLASQFPGVWIIATEKGHDWLTVREPTLIDSWPHFLELCSWIDENRPTTFQDGEPIRTLCLDTVDLLFNMCKDEVCRELGVTDPGELTHGKGWARLSSEFQRVMTKIRRWPYGLVCISHARDRAMMTQRQQVNRIEPDIGAGGARIVGGLADLILYCYSESIPEKNSDGELTGRILEERRMRCHPASNITAGGRMAKLLPPELPLDYNELTAALSKRKK